MLLVDQNDAKEYGLYVPAYKGSKKGRPTSATVHCGFRFQGSYCAYFSPSVTQHINLEHKRDSQFSNLPLISFDKILKIETRGSLVLEIN